MTSTSIKLGSEENSYTSDSSNYCNSNYSNSQNYSNLVVKGGKYSHKVDGATIQDFKEYCNIERRLSRGSVSHYANTIARLLAYSNKSPKDISIKDIRQFLSVYNNNWPYANQLKALKLFFNGYLKTELMKDFIFPRADPYVNHYMPTKAELVAFFNALENVEDKALFLLYATSGLRRNEVLDLQINDLDLEKRICYPNHRTQTKNAHFGFFNNEAKDCLHEWLNTKGVRSLRVFPISSERRYMPFKTARNRTNLTITPKTLRFWFSNEMARLGVPDRFIDAFQGRIPRSVLARHYTDYSQDNLKAIYDKANLKILS